MSKQYTYDDVKELSADTKTMFVINDLVYDITSFLNEHPGGEEVLLDHNGKDATEDFNDVGHSNDALALMKQYQIGEIVETERRHLQAKEGWDSNKNSTKPPQEDGGFINMYTIASVVIVIFAYFYFVY